MNVADDWLPISTAPRDGSRIIVSIRATEQGPPAVDIVRWDCPRRNGDCVWWATDTQATCAVVYREWELCGWMPMPTYGRASAHRPAPMASVIAEAEGSGI